MLKMFISDEAARCLLCANAPCTAACPNGCDPARGVRAVRFENTAGAGAFFSDKCADCSAPCETACIHYDFPIRIRRIARQLSKSESISSDLSIDFCGIHCENPFFLSSSVVASGYEMIARAFDMGWAGAVYKTIGFYKPEEVSPRFDAPRKEGTPFIGFRNMEQISDKSLEENLEIFRRLKRDYPDKILVSSIMGQTDEEWTELARLSEEAGADIIECNFSCPHMSARGMGSDVGEDPQLVKRYTELAKRGTRLPVLAKMTPNLAHIEIPARAAVDGGADGIAAINTIKSVTTSRESEVDGRTAVSGYSGKAVKPIALRFIGELARLGVPVSGMGGIESCEDALDFLAMGCTNLQITTAVMQYGYRIIDDLIDGLARHMEAVGAKSVSELIGTELGKIVPADSLDRKTVVYPKFDREHCVGCGRCYISCADGGHGAIRFGEDRKPVLDGVKCVGCHLCRLVCPAGAISSSKRVPKH
ncbi:MAG: NAD-dependent dihydropyrimidine dehydrogenase subunit PreA [Lachnospiraceae bacterium]|nr:NAD-dependent dihydropyrimidine dehydrogenase subunit PreA [Lachnospiraceae bacterium]